MKLLVLCGGSGTRLENYSFPKPLNMIQGKPAIYYTLKNVPECIDTLYFIVAEHLYTYNFEEIIINLFPKKKCVFMRLPYFTRGAIESAWLGTLSLKETGENIIFLDNDVLYEFPDNFFHEKSSAFIGYADDKSGSERFSFLKLKDNYIIEFKEKVRISEHYCCGVYGFKSISQFREMASEILNTSTNTEYYMSLLYQYMIKMNIPILGIKFVDTICHIGSLHELKVNWSCIPKRNTRICFDLDNTLVTYPRIHGDYSTVLPITARIDELRKLKDEGHIIIIYTARRMATHNGNVGAVIKDIGKVTIETLEKFNIPYDELYFGKPIADIYIDDRAINPYFQTYSLMGYLEGEQKHKPINCLKNNCYNTIELKGDTVIKKGPLKFLEGEIYYYENIPTDSILSKYYAKPYSFDKSNDAMINIEYIKGIPFYYLYKMELLKTNHIDKLFEYIDCLHSCRLPNTSTMPTLDDVRKNYKDKLIERFKNTNDYPFVDSESIQTLCLYLLDIYFESNTISIVPYIHGDLWFSNIILDFNNTLRVIDMKGKVNTNLTLGGDIYYDYGKVYQSILGYDMILNNESNNTTYSNYIKTYFLENIRQRGVCEKMLKIVTFSLILGTFHSISDIETRKRVWAWIKDTFQDLIK
jgi:capsule biosynthesis phosphatase